MDNGQTAQYQPLPAYGCTIYSGTVIVVPSPFTYGGSGILRNQTIPYAPATAYSTVWKYRPLLASVIYRVPAHPHLAAALAGEHGKKSVLTMWHQRKGDAITLALYVQPGAKHNEVTGLHGDALKIRLVAPPIEGRANEALLRFIASTFKVPLRNVELKQGAQSRHKLVLINGSTIKPESLLDSE